MYKVLLRTITMTGVLEKSLKIEKAKAGESLGIVPLSAYESQTKKDRNFKDELAIYGIKDIFKDTQIKQDGEKYIFIIQNQPKFLVDRWNLVPWIQKFYSEGKKDETEKVEKGIYIRLNEIQWEQTLEYIKWELSNLKEDIKRNMTTIERATDPENMKFRIGRLITFFEQEKQLTKENTGFFEGRKYDRKDTALRRLNRTEIDRRIKQLGKIKKQIIWLEENKKNKDEKYTIDRNDEKGDVEVKMSDINAFDMKTTLLQFNQRIEKLSEEAPEFIKSRNSIILETWDTTPYYEIILNNVKDATKVKIAFEKINNDYILLNKMALTADKRDALFLDLKKLQEYLQAYIRNPNKPLEKFVPTSGDAFDKLCAIDPQMQNFLKLNSKAGYPTDGKADPSYITEKNTGEGKETTDKNGTKDKNTKEYIPSTYGDSKEAFEKWGINGVVKHWIDQTNMKPNQKQFWWWVGNLAVTGWMIFVWWKMIKGAWNLLTGKHKGDDAKNKSARNADRAWLLGPTALLFGSQARSGEGPGKLLTWWDLTKKIAGIFGGASSTETANQTAQEKETGIKYKEWFPGATAVFNGLNYGEMKQFLIKDGDRMKIDPDKYDELLSIFKNGPKKNEAAVAFLEKSVGKMDERHVIDLTLTGMWLSMEDLEKNPKGDFNKDTLAPVIARLRSVTDLMETKGYNKMNSETQYLVDNYIANKDATISDLEKIEKRGDVFYKEMDIVDKTWLAAKVKELANGNLQKEEELLLALNTFYKDMPNAEKVIDINWTWSEITFKTYDQISTINLDKKSLVGFTPKGFTSYNEVFKAANLTNYIKKICKDKEAKSDKPFYLSPGKDITFDNANLFSTDFDTEIMTAGWWGGLTKISPILEDNKQAYCDYLNTITPKFWKEKPAV